MTEEKEPRRKSEGGLTLIELLAAMLILAFGAVAALSVLVEAQKSNNFARAKTMAVNAAEQQLESIFQLPPGDAVDRNNTTFAVGDLVGPGGNPPGLVTVDANQPHRITVTVTWQGQGALAGGTVTLRALRSDVDHRT